MRRTVSGFLLVISLWMPAAWAKHQAEQKEQIQPLFIAPEFHFSEVDTICVAPAIDLRPDTAQPLALAPGKPQHFVSGGVAMSADTALPKLFNYVGYRTLACNSVAATLDDLRAPSDAWIGKLDFGRSRWLFILAVEYVSSPYGKHARILGQDAGVSHAVVSGYLFEKQAAGGRLVWRDKVVGGDAEHNNGAVWLGNKERTQLFESEQAIEDGAEHLLAKFETRNKSIQLTIKSHTEIVDVTCNVLWAALIDALKNSMHYNMVQVDNSDMMAIFANPNMEGMAYSTLRPKDNSCSMQITLAPGLSLDLKSTSQRVHEVLSKQEKVP